MLVKLVEFVYVCMCVCLCVCAYESADKKADKGLMLCWEGLVIKERYDYEVVWETKNERELKIRWQHRSA